MVLRPAVGDLVRQPSPNKPKPKKVPVLWRPARNSHYDDLVELRARTVAAAHDDPLGHVDWWATIRWGIEGTPDCTAQRMASRLADQVIREKRLPTGLWAIRRDFTEQTGWGVAARFEGYRPWWIRCSAYTAANGYASSLATSYEKGEPNLPRIPDDAYLDMPVPDHVVDRVRRRLKAPMLSGARGLYNPYEDADDARLYAPWGETWVQFDAEHTEVFLRLREDLRR